MENNEYGERMCMYNVMTVILLANDRIIQIIYVIRAVQFIFNHKSRMIRFLEKVMKNDATIHIDIYVESGFKNYHSIDADYFIGLELDSQAKYNR